MRGWRLVLALVVAVGMVACSADGPLGGGRVSTVTMRFLTPATVKSLIVEVTGPGIDPAVVLNIPVGTDTVATGSLTLPSGSARRFVVTAVDTAGVQTHRADTTITLQPGANPGLAMRLEPLPSTLGIMVTFGGVRLVVPDTSTRMLPVAGSMEVHAFALRVNGDTVPADSLTWGSRNTAIVTATAGLISGYRIGMTTVVVGYQGAAATVSVEVFVPFALDPSGVTVVCPQAAVGDTATLGGVLYTKRDRAGLDSLVGLGAHAQISTTCTSGIRDMSALFFGDSLFNHPIASWDVSSVSDLSAMFYGANAFNQPIEHWNLASVTKMYNMFYEAYAFNQSVDAWNVARVTDMAGLFHRSASFNQPLDNWDVSQVRSMLAMFRGANAFNQDISGWDVSNVESMWDMFTEAHNFDQPIGSWDVSQVNQMPRMFENAGAFNQDLSGWCVSRIPSKPEDFDVGAGAWSRARPVWGTCPTN